MQLSLTEEDASTLRDLLRDVLPPLKMEVARTDIAARELLHELRHRRDVCEKVIEQLETVSMP
jgi:hypothetical protein